MMATYYVDASSGDDSNDGLSIGSAWQTVAKVNATPAGAGFLFKRGETWRDLLLPKGSTSEVIYGDYGSGVLPRFSGADVLSQWSGAPPFYGSSPLATKPSQVFSDEVRLVERTDCVVKLTPGEWTWCATDSSVYVRLPNDEDPAGHFVEASVRDTAIGIWGQSFVTLDGLAAVMGKSRGIELTPGYQNPATISDLVVRNCIAAHSRGDGLAGNSSSGALAGVTLESVKVFDNAWCGAVLFDRFSDLTVVGCEAYGNCWGDDNSFTAGIKTFSKDAARADDITIRDNRAYDNGTGNLTAFQVGYGVWLDIPGDRVSITDNLSYGNLNAGIQFEYGGTLTDRLIAHNICHHNGSNGIVVSRRNHNVRVHRNTCVFNGGGNIEIAGEHPNDPDDGGARVGMFNNDVAENVCYGGALSLVARNGGENGGTLGGGNTYRDNILGPEAAGFVQWGGVGYGTVAAWEAVTGGAASGNMGG